MLYLNRAVKEVTGKLTTTHVTERIIGEAKALLQHTNWNICANIIFPMNITVTKALIFSLDDTGRIYIGTTSIVIEDYILFLISLINFRLFYQPLLFLSILILD